MIDLRYAAGALVVSALACGGQTIDGAAGALDASAGRTETLDATAAAATDGGPLAPRPADTGPSDVTPNDGSVPASDAGCVVGTSRCSPTSDDGSVNRVLETCAADGTWTPSVCWDPTPECVENGSSASCTCRKDACPTVCTDLQTDYLHCGDCSNQCGMQRICQGGRCVCGESHVTQCDAAMVDTNRDNENCGACGSVCAGSCQCGRCLVTLATGQGQPRRLAVDGTNVYWTNFSDGTVMKTPAQGGGPITALASGQDSPASIAVDGTYAYWTNAGLHATGSDRGSVMRVALAGGSPEVLATRVIGPDAIAVDGASVYWGTSAIFSYAWGMTPVAGLRQVPLGGGTPIVLGAGIVSAVFADTSGVYWSDDLDIVHQAPGADAGVKLATAAQAPAFITHDAQWVYWTSGGSTYSLTSVALDGGAPVDLSLAGAGLAADGTHVYFGYAPGNSLAEVPAGGGSLTEIAWGEEFDAVAVDATSVYWVNGSAGTVERLTPK